MRRALVALALLAGCQGDLRLGVVTQAGGASFMVDPTSWDFGAITVGGSDSKTIVVSTFSDGGEDIYISNSDCTDFALPPVTSPVHVTAAEPFAMEVTFSPTSAAVLTCDITFQGDVNQHVVSLVGTGTVSGPLAVLAAPATSTLDFGDVPLTLTTAAQSIEVRNDGDTTLNILSAGFATGGGSELNVLATMTDAIAPGASQIWDVTCSPVDNGINSGTWEITTDGGGPFAVDITCNGISTDVYVLPVPAVFGEVLVGGDLELTFDLHYTGSGSEDVASVTIDDAAFTTDLNVGASVPGGGSTPFHVTFTPPGDGPVSGTMTITMVSSTTLNLGLSGMGATGLLSVTPPDPVIDFGTVCVGQDSEEIRVSLRNAGTGAFTASSMQNVPGPLHPFTGTSSTFPVTLPPGGTVEAWSDEKFSPLEAGEIDGEMQVFTNIPGDPLHHIPLHGRALEAVVGATHTEVEFGAVELGELSGAEDLGVLNCTAAGVIVGVELAGADADAFQILPGDPTFDVSVGQGETTTWSVLFQPTRAGANEASLVITWADGSVEIPLSGLGVEDLIPDPDPDPEERGSYLACSSGAPGSLGLVLLVLVAVCWRRRPR